MLKFAHNNGVEKGRKEGMKEAEITIAKNLLKEKTR